MCITITMFEKELLVRMTKEQKKELKIFAAEQDKTMSTIARVAIHAYVSPQRSLGASRGGEPGDKPEAE